MVIEDLIVTRNTAALTNTTSATANIRGGGISSWASSFDMTNSTISDNLAWGQARSSSAKVYVHGGGLAFRSGRATINSTWLAGNRAVQSGVADSSASEARGGGIYINNLVPFRAAGLTCIGNSALGTYAAMGGCFGMGLLAASDSSVVTISSARMSGNLARSGVAAQGGGAYCYSSSAVSASCRLLRSELSNNSVQAVGSGATSAQGGGLYSLNVRSSISKTVLSGNTVLLSGTVAASVSALGGGIYCVAVLTLGNNSMVSSNQVLATVSSGSTTVLSQGGGVYQSGSIFVNSTIVRSNMVQFDGTAASSTTLGGGIAIASGLLEGRSVQLLSNMAVSSGLSARGGGLYSSGSNVLLADCIVSGNVVRAAAQSAGGGLSLVLSSASPASLWRLTLRNNSAVAAGVDARSAQGGGLHVSQASRVTMAGSIIRENRASITSSSAFQAGASGGGIYTTVNLICNSVNLTSNQAAVSGTSAATEADAVGGGLYAQGTRVNFTQVLILNNTAVQLGTALAGSSLAGGGGIFLNGTCRLITTAGLSRMINNRAFSPYQRLGGLAYVSRRTRFLVHSGTVTVFEGVTPTSTTINTIHLEAGGLVTQPSVAPTTPPTTAPSQMPSRLPTQAPSALPTLLPTQPPSGLPTILPSRVRVLYLARRIEMHTPTRSDTSVLPMLSVPFLRETVGTNLLSSLCSLSAADCYSL
jgi:hypothetical protein